MISCNDFNKKQLIFVFCNDGERVSILNENVVVKDDNGKVKLQCSCYRIFLIYIVGHCSITTALIQKANRFGFSVALMTSGFHLYSVIGNAKEGNVLLKEKQYKYEGLGLAKAITVNKIHNQQQVLKKVRNKNEFIKEAIKHLENYKTGVNNSETLSEIMAYEGLSSKVYFRNHFDNVLWQGRQPRVKRDYVNSMLDIGYTILFSFIDAILISYGFDTYVGVLHRQFYMRKSLVCDMVEPFRPIVDIAVKKGINLKQIREDDFTVIRGQYKLKWENNSKYIKLIMTAILDRKEDMFLYIQKYYRAFMKEMPAEEFPAFILED